MTIGERVQRRDRPTAAQLAAEIHAVIAYLPRFATAPLYQRWQQRWGARDERRRRAYAGR
jgi:hypothetical protein